MRSQPVSWRSALKLSPQLCLGFQPVSFLQISQRKLCVSFSPAGFDSSNSIGRGGQSMGFLTMSVFASFSLTDQVSHRYKATGKLRFCIFYSLYFREQNGKTKDSGPNVIGNSVNLMRC